MSEPHEGLHMTRVDDEDTHMWGGDRIAVYQPAKWRPSCSCGWSAPDSDYLSVYAACEQHAVKAGLRSTLRSVNDVPQRLPEFGTFSAVFTQRQQEFVLFGFAQDLWALRPAGTIKSVGNLRRLEDGNYGFIAVDEAIAPIKGADWADMLRLGIASLT